MDECIEILCASVPSPPFIATLLQMSKRIRRLLWRFLIDPAKCDYDWTYTLCMNLAPHHTPSFKMTAGIMDGYPLFMCSLGKKTKTYKNYSVTKVSTTGIKIYFSRCRAFCVDKTFCDNYESAVDRESISSRRTMRYLDWFFVARALNINMDRLISQHTLNIINDGGIILDNDKDLSLF